MILAIFFVSLLAVSVVSAADNATDDVVSVEKATDDVVSVEKATDDVVSVEIEDNINVENNQAILGENENTDGNFTDLSNEIKSTGENQTLSLNKSYVFDSNCDLNNYITLDKPITIDGNNHFIDAQNSTGIFMITGKNVVLKNIIFKNAKSVSGAAINSRQNSQFTIINCTFINNTATSYSGGAIYVLDKNCSVINSTFESNSAEEAGNCIYLHPFAKNSLISGSKFFNNGGRSNGQVYFSDVQATIINCQFYNNNKTSVILTGKNSKVINSTFKNNNDYSISVISNNCIIDNCDFEDNVKYSIYMGQSQNSTIINCNFTNNSAYSVYCINSINGSISNCNFTNNSAYSILDINSINGSISNCFFNKNRDYSIFWSGGSNGKLCNSTFRDNVVGSRDVVAWNVENGLIFNNTFENNEGTAVRVSSDNTTIQMCSFNKNSEGNSIEWYNTLGKINNCTFINNNYTPVFYSGSLLTISNSNFENNSGGRLGGAIQINKGTLNISNSNFTNISAVYGGLNTRGGAIYSSNESYISDCNFMNCSADKGGAIYSSNELYISDCSFMNCSAEYNGGAIYSNELFNSSISDCSFMNCSARNSGGAIEVVAYNSSISDCSFMNCSSFNGGALYVMGNNSTVSSSNFVNCSADDWGGSICVCADNLTISNSNFTSKSQAIYVVSRENITISNNNIEINGDCESAITLYGGTSIITDNIINVEGSSEITGILLDSHVKSEIVNNEITSNGISAINSKSPQVNITIKNNGLTANGKYGNEAIKTDGGTIDAEGNTKVYLNPNMNVVSDSSFNETTLEMVVTINVSINETATENVTVTLYDSKGNIKFRENVTIIRGDAKFTKSGWGDDEYNYTVDYLGDDNFKPASINGTVTVKDPRSVAPLNVVANAGLDAKEFVMVVTINTTSEASGNVTVTLYNPDGSVEHIENVSFVNGEAIFIEANLANGVYNYTVEYRANAEWKANSVSGNVTVNDTRSAPDTDNISLSINGQSGTIKLPDDAQGKITVTIAGKDYEADVVNGVANVKLPSLADGKYDYTIAYSGDGKYSSFTKTGSLTVINPKIIAKDTAVQYSAKGKYSVTVYGSDGKAASGVYVVFKISGKQVAKVKTNAKGVATYVVTKNPGTYKISAAALGKTVTKKLTVNHILKLQKVKVKRSAKKLVIKATLAKVNGKYLKGKKIVLKFKGKKYKAKTNKKGVAKFTIKKKVLKKLKKGKKVTYQATYLKDTVKKTVKVKK